MGMTIEKHIEQLKKLKSFHNGSYGASINFAIDTMRKYQKMQADYETRLKADMVAMLEDISLTFDEQYYVNRHELHDDSLNVGLEQGQQIIQQKIDALKADKE